MNPMWTSYALLVLLALFVFVTDPGTAPTRPGAPGLVVQTPPAHSDQRLRAMQRSLPAAVGVEAAATRRYFFTDSLAE